MRVEVKEEKDKYKDVGINGCDCHACRRQARNDGKKKLSCNDERIKVPRNDGGRGRYEMME